MSSTATKIGAIILFWLGVGLIHHPRRQYLVAGALAFGAFLAATAGAPDIAIACLTLLATGATAFSFVTLCSTALQRHSSPAYRGRIMALSVYVYRNQPGWQHHHGGDHLGRRGTRRPADRRGGVPGRGRHRRPGAHPSRR